MNLLWLDFFAKIAGTMKTLINKLVCYFFGHAFVKDETTWEIVCDQCGYVLVDLT